MSNPLEALNPLEWLRSAQDWFRRTERSSGFRPYLISLVIVSGLSLALLSLFRDVPEVRDTALLLLKGSFGGFIVLFAVKAFQEPEFCRSESHVERMKKLEIESMGSETEALTAEIIEAEEAIEAPPEPPALPGAAAHEEAHG
jgi:hypothetical protein